MTHEENKRLVFREWGTALGRLDDHIERNPTDRECCEQHACPLPCEECRKGVQDEQADWKEGDR